MTQGPNQADVTLKAKFEGLQEALQGLQALRQGLASLNSGNRPSYSTPMGGAPTTVRSPEPPTYAAYASGGGNWLPPGHLAPPPPGMASSSTALVPQIGAAGPTANQGGGAIVVGLLNDIAINIREIRAILSRSGGVAGGGAGSGGYGGGGGFGLPPRPAQGPSWGNFVRNIAQNPTLGGIYGAMMNELPLPAIAAIGAAGYTSELYSNYGYQQQLPGYQLQTQQTVARMQGQFTPISILSAQQEAAAAQGRLNAERGLRDSTVGMIPFLGGIVRNETEQNVFQRLERRIAEMQAAGQEQFLRGQITGYSGRSAAMLGPGFLPISAPMAQMLAPFGAAASGQATAGRLLNPLFTQANQYGVDPVVSALASITSIGQNPAMIDFRNRLAGGTPLPGMLDEAYRYFASRGQMADVAGLLPIDTNRNRYEDYAAMARRIANLQGVGQIAGSQFQELGARSEFLIRRGAGVGAVTGAMGAERAPLETMLSALVSQRAVATDPQRLAELNQQIASLKAEIEAVKRRPGDYLYSLGGAYTGLYGAQAGAAETRARLFGGPAEMYMAGLGQVGVLGREIGRTQGRLAGQYGVLSEQERVETQRQLVDLQRQYAEALQSTIRGFYAMNTQLSQTTAGIAGAREQRGVMLGVGGLPALGLAQSSYETLAAVARNRRQEANAIAREIKKTGRDPMQNQGYLDALLGAEQAETQATGAYLDRSNVPFSVGTRARMSALTYQADILQTVPGAAGSLRGTQLQILQGLQGQYAEVQQREQEQRRLNGGQLTAEEAYRFQEQRQALGRQAAGAYAQLSYGWESRLMSQVVNAPGSFSFVAPMASYRAAVGAGVVNPLFGANKNQVPFWLREAGLWGGLAGSTGTPEGAAITALTGAQYTMRAPAGGGAEAALPPGVLNPPSGGATPVRLDGPVIIELKIPMDDGTFKTVPGVMRTTQGNQQGTSAAALGEMFRLAGARAGRDQ